MRRTVPRQGGKVIGVQEQPVPNLHPITPTPGQMAQELVQRGNEIPAPLELARREVGELEDQQADVGPELPARAQECRFK